MSDAECSGNRCSRWGEGQRNCLLSDLSQRLQTSQHAMVGSHSTHGNISFSPNEDSNVVQGPVIKDTLKSYCCCTEEWGDNKHWTCPALSREFLNKRIFKCCDWRLLTTGPVACPAMTHVERTASVTQWGIPRRDPLTYYDGCLTVSRQFLLVSNIWLSVHSQSRVLESFW